ncbi:MAG: hypothetical protein IPL87_02590 [Candidatus Moraniibacteriota bacterium]|nr:MAG: hypothetical protein IPL87_02590 [Candidatus Moranbacteria bacterium]
MNKKALIFATFLILTGLGGWFLLHKQRSIQNVPKQLPVASQQPVQVVEKPQGVPATVPGSTLQQPATQSEIESIKDLIDGEYTFTPIDTTNWQTYRNEELGFEVKIPKNWEMRELYREENKSIDIWFSQKGKWYKFEGGNENAIIIGISFKTNPFFQFSEPILKLWKASYNISIKRAVINGSPLYYYNGFGEGIMTTASFPKDYSFDLSSSLILDTYPDVRRVLRGMIQTVKFDGIN